MTFVVCDCILLTFIVGSSWFLPEPIAYRSLTWSSAVVPLNLHALLIIALFGQLTDQHTCIRERGG